MRSVIVTLDPTSDPRWSELVMSRRSDIFHSPAWLLALRDTYDLPIEARVLIDDERPVAGFVYSPIADLMDPRVISLPFSDFCDPLVSTEAEWRALTDGVLDDRTRFQLRCVHSEIPLSDPLLAPVGRARWHAVDLARPSDDIWDTIDPSARRSIRKARKQRVEVRAGQSVDDIRAFYELHLRVRKYKYGLLAQPWRFFESIWDRLLSEGMGTLLMAMCDGNFLGGVLFLEWDDTLYYKFNASDPEALGVRPNDLVIWEGIQHAMSRGLKRFDFGLSDWDQEGLLRFKRKYATEEKTIHTLRHMPSDAPSGRETQTRALLPQLTDLFTAPEIPDATTEAAGDLLYRYFT